MEASLASTINAGTRAATAANAENAPSALSPTTERSVVARQGSWAILWLAAHCHCNGATRSANATNPECTVRSDAPPKNSALADRNARKENAAHVVAPEGALKGNCVARAPVSPDAATTWTVPATTLAYPENVKTRAFSKMPAEITRSAACRSTACYACVLTASVANQPKDVLAPSARQTTIANRTRTVLAARVSIHACKAARVEAMRNAASLTDSRSAHVLPVISETR